MGKLLNKITTYSMYIDGIQIQYTQCLHYNVQHILFWHESFEVINLKSKLPYKILLYY